jgi:adenylate cyclase
VVLAEIELAAAGQELALPDWIGAEVTSDPRYRKINMIADRVANQKAADTAQLARADEVIE